MNGKVALITGGSTGIGRATCIALAKQGAKIAFADLNEDAAKETKKILKDQYKIEALFIKANVSKREDVERMVQTVVKHYGRLDLAFNNAGIGGFHNKLHEYDDDVFDSLMQVNLKGVYLCMKYEIKQMLLQGGEGYSIVNTSSISGLVAYRGNAPYGAVKHAVVGLTKSAAIEYARSGIRINSVCPSFTLTQMLPDDAQLQSKLADRVPLHRLGTAEEVANVVAFLLSDAASYSTGLAIPICGGLSAL